VPSIARAYDHLLGGKDNFAADRELTKQILRVFPEAALLARENRGFLARAVDFVAGQGIDQFIDVGAGLPTRPCTHEVARQRVPGARVAYVDNDPVVISHTAALVRSDGVAAVAGDMHHPAAILAAPGLTELIDLGKPACVILAMVLHFTPPDEATRIVAGFTAAMATGSYLVLSIGTSTDNELADQVIAAYRAGQLQRHSKAQIAGYFDGFELVDPGLRDARAWRADWEVPEDERPIYVLAGVGLKRLAGHQRRS
jgi:O-methyltransferase involved in polyketide biosynthesis